MIIPFHSLTSRSTLLSAVAVLSFGLYSVRTMMCRPMTDTDSRNLPLTSNLMLLVVRINESDIHIILPVILFMFSMDHIVWLQIAFTEYPSDMI